MQPYMSDQTYGTKVQQRECGTALQGSVALENNKETSQQQKLPKDEPSNTTVQFARMKEAKTKQEDPNVATQTISPEEEIDNVSSKDTKTAPHSLSSPGFGEGTISDSQEGQSLESPDKTSNFQKRRSLQRENHNAHTQRCREKINQMFQRLNEALPPRADGSHPRKKAEILTRALEIVKELQVENMSLKETIQSMSRAQIGLSGQAASLSFPVVEHLPLQGFARDFIDIRTNMMPPNGDVNIHQQSQQFGNSTMLREPPVSLPFLPLNSVTYAENEDRRFAVPPASKTPKLPPIIPTANVGRFGVSQIDSGPPASFPDLSKVYQEYGKTNWFSSMDKFLSEGSYVSGSTNVTLLPNVAVPTTRNLDSIPFQELEQDSAGVVPQTTAATGTLMFPRKETEHKDI